MDRVTYGDEEAGAAVRAVRGVIHVDADERDEALGTPAELLQDVLGRNGFDPEDHLISVIFAAIPDLRAEFPAYAARQMGISVARRDVRHVYLRGAAGLRTDLPK